MFVHGGPSVMTDQRQQRSLTVTLQMRKQVAWLDVAALALGQPPSDPLSNRDVGSCHFIGLT